MPDSSLTLTGEERDYLVDVLQSLLKDTRFEEKNLTGGVRFC